MKQGSLILTATLFSSVLLTASEQAVAQQSCAPVPSGLVSWWRAEGNAQDVNGLNNGELINGAKIVTGGKVGKAFQFDGDNDIVLVPDSPSLRFGNSSSFTIELWWNRSLNNLPFHVVGKRPGCGSLPYYQIGIDSSSPLSIRVTGEWIHVAEVYNATNNLLYYYVNGSEVFSGSKPDTSPTSADFIIGGSGTCAHFGGLVDEVSVYNRALSTAEIQAIASAGSSGKCIPDSNINITAFPNAGSAPLTVDFNAHATSPKGTTITQYLWDVNGDGIPDQITTTGNLQYTYQANGTYNAGVQVVDSAGGSGTASKPVKVTVGPRPELLGQVEYYEYDDVTQTMHAKVRVYNTGDTNAPSFNTIFILSDNGKGATTFKTINTATLAAQQNTLLDVTYTFPESIYGRRVSVFIDSGRKVKEVDETNNGASMTIAPLATQ